VKTRTTELTFLVPEKGAISQAQARDPVMSSVGPEPSEKSDDGAVSTPGSRTWPQRYLGASEK